MRLVFAGTPEFARLAYERLVAAGHEVPLVLTQPDRPAGRGLKLTASPVKQAALARGAQVLQPRSLRRDGRYPEDAAAAAAALTAVAPDVMIVAAYGLLLPPWVLALPTFGCLNIHASLLPRWRGAAPIQRAIEAGDTETGITIMQMDEGLDTGHILLCKTLRLERQTAGELHDELASLGADAIVTALERLQAGTLEPTPQPGAGVTYAQKIDKREARLDLQAPAALLERKIRALNPSPGASLALPGLRDPLKVWQAQALSAPTPAAPGELVQCGPKGIDLATGHGILRLLQVQKSGGKRQSAADFVRGWSPA